MSQHQPGYSDKAMARIDRHGSYAASVPNEKPDIIVVMSKILLGSDKVAGVTVTPDPIPTMRALRSGSMFSPEFGGMTAISNSRR